MWFCCGFAIFKLHASGFVLYFCILFLVDDICIAGIVDAKFALLFLEIGDSAVFVEPNSN